MNTPLFPDGIKGLADSKWSAYEGECDKLVGIDFRSTPGIIKAHQKLTKNSGATVTDLCKNVVELEDGKKIWFSSESGKIWQQSGDTFTLLHTIVPATDYKERNSIVAGLEDIPEYEDIEDGITMSIAENSAGYGKISSIVSSTIDVDGGDGSAIEASTGYFAVAYQGTASDGFVKIFQMSSSGSYSEIEVLEHDTTNGSHNSLCKIDDSHFMLAYKNSNNGRIKTFSWTTNAITEINVLDHSNPYGGEYNSLIQIDATHYALAYNFQDRPIQSNMFSSSGWVLSGGWTGTYATFFRKGSSGTTPLTSAFIPTIGAKYQISLTMFDHSAYGTNISVGGYTSANFGGNQDWSFTTTECTTTDPLLFNIYNTGARFSINNLVIKELLPGGSIKIFTIDGSFNITETSELIHETAEAAYGSSLVLIDSTHLMLAYTDGTAKQIIKTFTIDGSWNVVETDSLIHAPSGDLHPRLLKYDSTHFIWSGQIVVRGYMKVFTIDGSYQITETTALDISTFNNYPSLLKTDETHIILSSRGSLGFVKVFEINPTTYKMKELGSQTFSGGNETSILRNFGKILVVHTDSGLMTATVTINETYSNGIVLNPLGTEEIKLIYSKVVTRKSLIDQYLRTTIKIPEGYNNMQIVVIAGRAGAETYPSVGVTMAGLPISQINTRTTTYGFKASSAYYNSGVTSGEKEVVVDFGALSSNLYVSILVFSNVHAMIPYTATTDYGWKDYLQLPGTTKGELRIGAFLTKINPHYSGDLQKEALQENISEDRDDYTFSVSMRKFGVGTAKTLSASLFSYLTTEVVGNENESYIPEEQKQKIYYANEDILFAVPVEKISAWADNVETVGEFRNGDDTYHSMVKQNLELYIGDNSVISKVNTNGDFIPETSLNVMAPERIQVLSAYDTDILIGTKNVNKARVLRWDTFSDSWIADDDVMETGINAFILDDDYTYVSAGDFGHLYFYNGEKLNITKNIPGDWDSTHTAKINANAVGYLKGIPVFGLSNITGNPTLQGIYGFGGYDVRYAKALSLDFPLPTNEFSGAEIGAINVNGSNMYVSYKTGTDVGIAKLDNSNKYNNAYLETALVGALKERDDYSIHEGLCIDYVLLPTNTAISLSTKTKYEATYTTQEVVPDPDKLSIKTKASIPDVLNLQAKMTLTSDGNNCPLIENIGLL